MPNSCSHSQKKGERKTREQVPYNHQQIHHIQNVNNIMSWMMMMIKKTEESVNLSGFTKNGGVQYMLNCFSKKNTRIILQDSNCSYVPCIDLIKHIRETQTLHIIPSASCIKPLSEIHARQETS